MKKQYEEAFAEVIDSSTDFIISSVELPFDSTEEDFDWKW